MYTCICSWEGIPLQVDDRLTVECAEEYIYIYIYIQLGPINATTFPQLDFVY